MNKKNIPQNLAILAIVFLVGFGCKRIDSLLINDKASKITQTEISKESIIIRLAAKGVKQAEPIDKKNYKPNPLTLQLRFGGYNDNYYLNQELHLGFSSLADQLKLVRDDREANGIFVEGTNIIAKKLTLPLNDTEIKSLNVRGIFIEDFESLVDELKKIGFDQLEISTTVDDSFVTDISNNDSRPANKAKDSNVVKGPPQLDLKSKPQTVSGGIINGKAINLPKPEYPASARAVRAYGSVTVNVTVDESGNIIEAIPVSGHLLLRTAAASAAKRATFKPTLLAGKPVRVTGVIVYNFAQ